MIFIGAALLLIGLYLFLIAPNLRPRKDLAWMRRPFAHRGLHGDGVPENSLPAFERAVRHGYGIEWDVHLTRDGKLIVHHDDSLLRTCGVDRMISSMDAADVLSCRLFGTEEAPPLLEEALSLVAGRAPLIIELKSAGKRNEELARSVHGLLREYPGPFCVESFDPRLMRWYKRFAPGVTRGQLAFDPGRQGEKRKGMVYFLGAHLLLNFLSRPDFVAYGYRGDRNPSFRAVRALFRPATAAWTVSTQQDFEKLRGVYDTQIFEGFQPNK